MIFSVDGMQWDIPCRIERTAELTASEISGLLLDKSYFNDVLGTYMRYDVTLAVPWGYESEYAALYEELTRPVDGHTFVLPYGSGTVTVTGRVTDVHDVWRRTPGGTFWAGTAFTVLSNHPTKTMTLDEVISRGFAPLPDESAVSVGSAYEYTANGWTVLRNADNTGY